MKCPNCDLINADFVQRCDCGYTWAEGGDTNPAQRSSFAAKLGIWVLIVPLVLAVGALGSKAGKSVLKGASGAEDFSIEEVLQVTARQLNEGNPMTVDPHSRVEKVVAGPGLRFTYLYTLTDVDAKTADAVDLRKGLEPMVRRVVCSNDMRYFRENGVTVSYEFSDAVGRPLLGISMHPSQCDPQ